MSLKLENPIKVEEAEYMYSLSNIHIFYTILYYFSQV